MSKFSSAAIATYGLYRKMAALWQIIVFLLRPKKGFSGGFSKGIVDMAEEISLAENKLSPEKVIKLALEAGFLSAIKVPDPTREGQTTINLIRPGGAYSGCVYFGPDEEYLSISWCVRGANPHRRILSAAIHKIYVAKKRWHYDE